MANFLLVYTGGGMPETQEQQAAVLQQWGAWYEKLGAAVVDAGNPFTGAAKSIDTNGQVSDGPVGVMATGYTILKADSLDAAVEMSKDCPVLAGGSKITIYETFNVM